MRVSKVNIVAIHGSFRRDAGWAQVLGPMHAELVRSLEDVPIRWIPFKWSKWNSHSAREQGAMEFNRQVSSLICMEPETLNFCIGHSHGGNIALMTAGMSTEMAKRFDGIVCISTPFFKRKLEADGKPERRSADDPRQYSELIYSYERIRTPVLSVRTVFDEALAWLHFSRLLYAAAPWLATLAAISFIAILALDVFSWLAGFFEIRQPLSPGNIASLTLWTVAVLGWPSIGLLWLTYYAAKSLPRGPWYMGRDDPDYGPKVICTARPSWMRDFREFVFPVSLGRLNHSRLTTDPEGIAEIVKFIRSQVSVAQNEA